MINRWNFIPLTDEQENQKVQLSEALGISPVLCQLLVQRGITTFAQAKSFFRPQLADLHDPFLMNDMEKAVDRLNRAIGNKERILVYGDYDVDGITAVALVYKFLKQFYSNVDFYIPDRYTEGYGVSSKGINYAVENKIKLIIALDCGIKEVEKVDYANKLGVDFIICDHHTPDECLPNAVAVLDSKRADNTYPDVNLSGCGVGFKFMQAFASNNGIPFDKLEPMLDFLAVSIASDIVPINGENRILAYYGLKQLNSNPSLGMKSIIDVCGLADKEITISDIVFKIGPRLNASGRMQTARESVELLISRDLSFAKAKSDCIDQYNNKRKDLDKSITDEAKAKLESEEGWEARNSIVVYNTDWNKGVIAIVASRLTEMYYKPTIVLTHSNGFATGSGRSVQGFDIYKAIESCRDLLENFGGHMYAAGLTMKEENLPEFARRMNSFVSGKVSEEMLVPVVDIDARLSFDNITPKFSRLLKQFQPFGPGNTNPVFVTENVYDSGNGRKVGAGGVHLKLDLVLESQPYHRIPAIGFNMSEYYDYIREGNAMDVCYSIVENYYKGSSSLQLRLRDIRKRDDIDL